MAFINGDEVWFSNAKLCGKNLLDIDNCKIAHENQHSLERYPPKIENGTLYSGGLLGASSGGFVYIETDGNSFYTISCDADFDETTETDRYYHVMLFNGFDEKGFMIDKFNLGHSTVQKGKNIIVKNANGYKYIGLAAFSNTRYGIATTNIQFEKGKAATDYEPYFHAENATLI